MNRRGSNVGANAGVIYCHVMAEENMSVSPVVSLTLFLLQAGPESLFFNTSQVNRKRCENVQTKQNLLLFPQVSLTLCCVVFCHPAQCADDVYR